MPGREPRWASDHVDLLILGSGSTAFAAATRARELDKTVAMIETRTLGGTCVNRGCLPSKNLIEAARLVYDAAHPRYPGLAPARIEVDFAALVAQKDEIIHEYREQHYTSILDEDGNKPAAQVIAGRAAFVDAHSVEAHVAGGEPRRLTGDQILIATGSAPHLPEIAGLGDVPYLTSDLLTSGEAAELTTLPRSLAILGGGYIALELGQLFSRLGTAVTIIERSPAILAGFEPEVRRALTSALRAEGITIVTRSEVTGVAGRKPGVRVSALTRGQPREFAAERLLVATGRRPNISGLGLERAGVRLNARGAVLVDAALRTSVAHIWAAGDVIAREMGGQMATPVGARDGGIAASNALSGTIRHVDHSVIPRVIFTDPQVAVVGLTDLEAQARGIACQCNAIPLRAVPRAGAIRDTRGVVKMVLERQTRRVLGVSLVGANAGEVIHEAAMALRFGATADDFIDLIHAYPTMAEALKLVALSFTKDVSKLSCCAS